jgi:hypothetical protein
MANDKEEDLHIEEGQDGTATVELPDGILPKNEGENASSDGGDDVDHPDDSEAVRAARRARRRSKKDLIRKTNEEKDVRLQAIQRRNFYQLAAEASHRGRYYHEYTMSVDVTRDSPTGQPPTADAEEVVTEALRDLARWLYRQLQAEYDHLTSDEAIEEGIIVNEYTFTEGGRRFG